MESVEKPAEPMAMRLLVLGALWNTFLVAGRGRAFWRLAAGRLPELTRAFARYRRRLGQLDAGEILRDIYEKIPTKDLSRDVLQRAEGLAVVAMPDAGWSDCGTPERLMQVLGETGELPALLARIDRARLSPALAVAGAAA